MVVSSSNRGKWADVLTVVPIVSAVLATLIYLLRLYSRRLGGSGFMIEDALMGIGLLLSYGATIFVIYTAFNGVGRPTSSLPRWELVNLRFVSAANTSHNPDTDYSSVSFLQGSWMIQKFWAPSLAFIKISIIIFIRRIMGPIQILRNISLGLIIFTIAWAVTALTTNIFQCWPVTHYYKLEEPGHCMKNQNAFFETMGSFSLIVDVCVLCLPMPWVLKLHVDFRRKIGIVAIFSIGGLVCIFSLLRLVQFRYFLTTNLASSSALESIWTILEIHVAVICGCLPFLTPLCRSCLDRVRTNSSKSKTALSQSLYVRSGSSQPPNDNAGFRKLAGGYQDPQRSMSSTSRIVRRDSLGPSSNNNVDDLDDDSSIELQGITVHTVVSQAVERKQSGAEKLGNGTTMGLPA
ncbi:hypothetical protein DPV78_004618 [Talaromyces pinophilus]|nr:hypothetical protein DPV78_004618 [Talaromyces pinophilus]